MKKSLLIASLMVVALAACSKKEEAPAPAPVVETPAAAPVVEAAPAAAAGSGRIPMRSRGIAWCRT